MIGYHVLLNLTWYISQVIPFHRERLDTLGWLRGSGSEISRLTLATRWDRAGLTLPPPAPVVVNPPSFASCVVDLRAGCAKIPKIFKGLGGSN